MRYLNEFRDATLARPLAESIQTTQRWRIMEVCGGQTHSILRNGLDQILPVEFLHGPGCPVCVTPLEIIDRALAIAARPEVIFCSYGDMLRVPGSSSDLFAVKSQGGDIRVVYSPLDALELARQNPNRQVVFFAVGFETTAPAHAMAVDLARRRGITNFSLLVSHVLVPPAIEAILSAPNCRVQGFLLAGHVCSVMGWQQYPELAARYKVPMVVAGFEPLDLLEAIRRLIAQLESGHCEVENAYPRVVNREGNQRAQALLAEVFTVTDRAWRGIGTIPRSGWQLSAAYADYDAELRFPVAHLTADESPLCHAGQILRGELKPDQCPAFGRECDPRHPLGATMVSSEGACAAYYHSGRLAQSQSISQIVNAMQPESDPSR